MTYKYFNTSFVGFGMNITNAFRSLAKALDRVEDSVGRVVDEVIAINNQYVDSNYKVPIPIYPDSPCRVRELLDILEKTPIIIKEISLADGVFTVDVITLNEKTLKVTHATGGRNVTDIANPRGYVILKEAVDNNDVEKSLQFVSEIPEGNEKNVLFQYRIEKEDGIINLDNLHQRLANIIYPGVYTAHYKDINLDTVAPMTMEATGYQALIGITNNKALNGNNGMDKIEIDGNSKHYVSLYGSNINSQAGRVCGIFYLYPGEKVQLYTSSPGVVRRVKYISGRRGHNE